MAEVRRIDELTPQELAEAGYDPRVISSASKLPPQLVEEMLALNLQQTTGGEGDG